MSFTPLQAQPVPFVNTLMPQPAHISEGSGNLALGTQFTACEDKFHDGRLDRAVSRLLVRLKSETGLQIATAPGACSATLTVSVDGAGEAIQSDDEDESYSLEVTGDGAHLHAATVVGAIHGLATVYQLVQAAGDGWVMPAVSIQDAPRFRWRGLMIDSSRHWIPIDVIYRTLDGMAAVKMNVFHWHLSDDQGFRIESKVFPKLQELGSDGDYYTQDQVRSVIAYARDRGIRVVPEFDIPGHALSWLVGYPDLASGVGTDGKGNHQGPYAISREYGVFDPVLDPTRESTYQFLDKFISEMTALFPDPYFHVGGDENNGVQWKNNPRIQAFMKAHDLKDTAALQTYFNQKLLPILKKNHKKMIGWDEIFAPGLDKDAVIQSWRGFDSLAASAKAGYGGILSAGYYLDHIDSAEQHYAVDPIPAGSDLTAEQAARIFGGEACMWSEHLSPRSVDSRIWPRTAVVAERLWSPQSVSDVSDMYRRLWVESVRLEDFGLQHLSAEDMALRKLAAPEIATPDQVAPLRIFASVLQPVGFDERYQLQHTSQLTPMDHLIDAVRPDPPSRFEVEAAVAEYLKHPSADSPAHAQLEAWFQQWVTTAPQLAPLMKAPLLQEAAPKAEQFGQLGQLGLDALKYLDAKQAAPAGWKDQSLALLKSAKEPIGKVRFTVLEPLTQLVQSVQ
ncbi:beta-N-acetylhexosaminidase [Silvibacterium dinghuense]|uniref:Glycosyl hydrolase n=1 Tax=Silvibacterium dinghuense TaxID=1560006 RepID=A0A4Q1SEB6_9BACT|nr:family 20 glycosylhydrolase [Silvibacterium dinghuense]RXS95421.1 glycosyl hydrolase [Silvibacterium dinghuense]